MIGLLQSFKKIPRRENMVRNVVHKEIISENVSLRGNKFLTEKIVFFKQSVLLLPQGNLQIIPLGFAHNSKGNCCICSTWECVLIAVEMFSGKN
jgi:hypothetical protein